MLRNVKQHNYAKDAKERLPRQCPLTCAADDATQLSELLLDGFHAVFH